LRANHESNLRCHFFQVAFVWELTDETIHLPLGFLQGGVLRQEISDGVCIERFQSVVVWSLVEGRRGLIHRNVQRFRGGLVLKNHRLCVSLNSTLERNKKERRRNNRPRSFRVVVKRTPIKESNKEEKE